MNLSRTIFLVPCPGHVILQLCEYFSLEAEPILGLISLDLWTVTVACAWKRTISQKSLQGILYRFFFPPDIINVARKKKKNSLGKMLLAMSLLQGNTILSS